MFSILQTYICKSILRKVPWYRILCHAQDSPVCMSLHAPWRRFSWEALCSASHLTQTERTERLADQDAEDCFKSGKPPSILAPLIQSPLALGNHCFKCLESRRNLRPDFWSHWFAACQCFRPALDFCILLKVNWAEMRLPSLFCFVMRW